MELNCAVIGVVLFFTFLLTTIAHDHRENVKVAGPPPNAIFVFGDSYLDAGNHNKSAGLNRPWLEPYGTTYPGRPAGRFSDGRVFADLFADALSLPSPVAYELRFSDPNAPKYGMNFAVGGSGVFNPWGMLNLRGQIDQFESMINTVYPTEFLGNSVVLVGIHGNDYGAYIAKGNPLSGLSTLQELVTNEMVLQLERLYKSGLRTFYVNNLQPVGCLPSSTSPDFSSCIDISNEIVSTPHNKLLVTAIAALKNRLPGSTFTILDHFNAFEAVLQDPTRYDISAKPFMPCCLGAANASRNCGDVDKNGKPLFTVCTDPATSFFWDTIHPTQAGWTAVTKFLFPNAALEL